MAGVVERVTGHQDQVLALNDRDTKLVVAVQDLRLLHDVGIGLAVGHGHQDGVAVVYVFQNQQMVPVSVAVHHADALLPRLCRGGQPAGSLVQGGCLHIPRYGNVLA